jgi:uroporphyrinogen-III synthase
MRSRGVVVVTRPLGQAGALCADLVSRGFTPHKQPLLDLQRLPALSPQCQQTIENINNYQHLIFISGNAVRFGMEKILERWPQVPKEIKVYAIGESTATMLREYGIEAVYSTQGTAMTSESLLSIASLQGAQGQNVLIVKGQGGRTTLSDTLSKRGAVVDNLSCYQRKCPTLAAGELARKIASWDIELILISSGEGLRNMLTLLSPAETIKLCVVPLIVPSNRVARMAEEAGFSRVHTAQNASNTAMLEMVECCSSMSEKNT